MSEIASFGNLVNALNSVREDYSESLKAVPQYEAFLLVESSAQRVVETLKGLVSSSAPATAAEVISSLELAQTKFKEHLKSVPEYRALLAIEKLISDVSVDLGVQPAAAQTVLPGIEIETSPQEIAPARSELLVTVTAAVLAITQPEVAEIAAAQEAAATGPESDPAVSAAEHLVTQPEAAEIAAPLEVDATEAGLAVSAAEHPIAQPEAGEVAAPQEAAAIDADVAVSAPVHPITQPEATEIAPVQEAEAKPEVEFAAFLASVVEHTIAKPEAAEITATPLPASPLMRVRNF
jgi:hypothetical protein